MSKKRFTYLKASRNNYIGSFFCNDIPLTNQEVIDLLNENEQLKLCNNCIYWRLGTTGLNDNYCTLTDEWADWEGTCEKWKGYHDTTEKRYSDDAIVTTDHLREDFIKIWEENERLKQDNQRLIKMLDNAANYMQKEHREIPLDDFVEWWNNIVTEGLDD